MAGVHCRLPQESVALSGLITEENNSFNGGVLKDHPPSQKNEREELPHALESVNEAAGRGMDFEFTTLLSSPTSCEPPGKGLGCLCPRFPVGK